MNYTVKRGDTLNSTVQAAGFKNYKEAGITSVPSGNFDLIRPGEVINVGNAKDTSAPPVVTTPVIDPKLGGAGTSTTNTGITVPAGTDTSTSTTTPRDVFDYAAYQKDIADQKASLESEKEAQRQAIINAITNKYNTQEAGIKTTGAAELARTRSLNLRSGLINSPVGDTEVGSTNKKTQDALDANNAAKEAEIMASLNDLDSIYYTKERNIATDKLNEIKTASDIRTANLNEQAQRKAPTTTILQSLAKKGVTFDQFKLDPSYQNVKNDFSDQELQALFVSNAPSSSFISDKPEIVGSNAIWFQKQADGTVKSIKVDMGVSGDNIKDVIKTDSGIYIINKDGTHSVIGGSGVIDTSDEYAKAQKFVQDNPTATPAELEQSIRANTKNLSEADIKSLTGGATSLSRENISKWYGITDDETKTGGFLGIGGETGKAKLDSIMNVIDQYKSTGMSDADILKALKSS